MPTIHFRAAPTSGEITVSSEEALAQTGPVLPVELKPLDEHARLLKKSDHAVQTEKGFILVDTGAKPYGS